MDCKDIIPTEFFDLLESRIECNIKSTNQPGFYIIIKKIEWSYIYSCMLICNIDICNVFDILYTLNTFNNLKIYQFYDFERYLDPFCRLSYVKLALRITFTNSITTKNSYNI